MASVIPFFRPWLGEEELSAMRAPLERAWLTQGPEVEAFEAEFAAYTGAGHAIAVCNGTAALHLMLLALDIGPGDEVICPSHSFIATSNAVRYVGAEVVFVDIEPETLNLDPEEVERAFTKRTKAVLAVHQFGMPCDLRRLLEICRRHSVALLEDAACAIGSEIDIDGKWERIGAPHAAIASFSFHPRKLLTTGEGGMLVTGDPDLAMRLRRLRQHGLGQTTHRRQAASDLTFHEVGYNFRLSDLLAAVGRVQLQRLEPLLRRRQDQFERYQKRFGALFQHQPAWARSNRQTAALLLPHPVAPVIAWAKERGVALAGGIVNAHQTPAYRPEDWRSPGGLAHSEQAHRQTLLLPLYHGLSEHEQKTVIDVIEEALSQVLS